MYDIVTSFAEFLPFLYMRDKDGWKIERVKFPPASAFILSLFTQ